MPGFIHFILYASSQAVCLLVTLASALLCFPSVFEWRAWIMHYYQAPILRNLLTSLLMVASLAMLVLPPLLCWLLGRSIPVACGKCGRPCKSSLGLLSAEYACGTCGHTIRYEYSG